METNPPVRLEQGIPYGTGGGRELLLDILRPDVQPLPARPAVIWVHGGGWQAGERSPSPSPVLAALGFVTASISYRFSDEAIFPAQIHDVKAAIRFLRANAPRWGIDPERIGIWGHSAGGHLAALAAVSEGVPALEGEGGTPDEPSDVQAAVPLSPPTDFLVDWFEGSAFPRHAEAMDAVDALLGGADLDDPEVRARADPASPARLATPQAPPILVVHGSLDDLVPISQGARLVENLQGLGVDATLMELRDDDHGLASVFGSIFDVPRDQPLGADDGIAGPAMREIVDFFVRTLGPIAPISGKSG